MGARQKRREGMIVCRLADIMRERHLTIAAVVRLCGVSRPTIRQWKRNMAGRYYRHTLSRFCAGLGIQPGSLFMFIDGPEYQRAKRQPNHPFHRLIPKPKRKRRKASPGAREDGRTLAARPRRLPGAGSLATPRP